MYDKGIRIIQFVDNQNNALCSCFTSPEGGLTPLGKEIIIYMESKKMIVDVANMNPQSMIETYRFAKRPLLNSHTNIMSLHQDKRNITDEFLDRIDPSDGLIGLSLNAEMIVGPDAKATIEQFMDQVEYVKNHIGEDQVALGSCYHSFSYPKMVEGLETVSMLKLLEEKMTERF
jgi:membrane dipeptidase